MKKILLFLSFFSAHADIAHLSCPYESDLAEHKRHFFEWVQAHDGYLEGEYQRAVIAVSCLDADAIPRCPNAGRVFYTEKGAYQLMHNGVKVEANGYCGQWMTDLIFGLQGCHEPQEEKVFNEVLKYLPSKAVMIELGSYWAYYSLWFAKSIQEPTLYLIEPNVDYLEVGKRNFALNNCSGSFFHGYVGDRLPADKECQNAQPILIDDFLMNQKIDRVHILHSDVQGAEYEMLLSASSALDKQLIDYCFISTHSEELHRKCLQFLEEKRYIIIAHHTLEESYSVDGFIGAKRAGLLCPDAIAVSKR